MVVLVIKCIIGIWWVWVKGILYGIGLNNWELGIVILSSSSGLSGGFC